MNRSLLFALLVVMTLQFNLMRPFSEKDSRHPASTVTCKVKTNDIGKIEGHGNDESEAFSDAATQCFDRREKLYLMNKNRPAVDEESGIVMIDDCANIKCG